MKRFRRKPRWEKIADIDAIQTFWTEVLQDSQAKTADRLKASELLARSQGAFLRAFERAGGDSDGGRMRDMEAQGPKPDRGGGPGERRRGKNMKTELEMMEAAGLDMEAVRRRWAFMNSLQGIGPEGRKNRLLFLRALVELARKNAVARPIVERLLDLVGGKLPEEAATFRDYYLDGEKQPSARQIARRRFVDTRTIYRHNRVILSAMLVPVFGVNGYFRMDSEQEPYRETAQERKRAYDREYHRQRREKAKGAAKDRQETVGKTRER